MTPSALHDLFEVPPLTILEAGAGGREAPTPWAPLVAAGHASWIAIEARSTEGASLATAAAAPDRVIDAAVGDGSTRTLHTTRRPAFSTLHEPNPAWFRTFRQAAPDFEVLDRHAVRTRRLDDFEEIPAAGCDLLYLDLMGAEADALAHASRLLSRAVIVQVGVFLLPLLSGAGTFGQVDRILRDHGFVFHTRPSGYVSALGPAPYVVPIQQEIWGDFVYVKDFSRAEHLDRDRWIRFAALAHALYGSHDLAHRGLALADTCDRGDRAQRYLAAWQASRGTIAP
ncbi:MAG: FkbM family methyltransferase [Burkholderiales bacterium]|nr:FkbM family methyltransferase [Burkholderiales bacterium]